MGGRIIWYGCCKLRIDRVDGQMGGSRDIILHQGVVLAGIYDAEEPREILESATRSLSHVSQRSWQCEWDMSWMGSESSREFFSQGFP